ncbi:MULTISPECIES: hypothetical protein [unclassified Sporosarcina]|uniref:hypothetical protein n=1 Tax=unclassified Sporosarcina TaxID=2647733 RepID=UPI002041C563|nr:MULTISPECIES: hypothetical protein [unclassified Sporosarcina]GKV65539.1 hypothetical protein NCCP2331_16920 [Sporosarcina sp. NCCP-2331]GLB55664.1 hypothetical protein NCCP2378_14510 [Sporosarcina sp. NCCP-2378]
MDDREEKEVAIIKDNQTNIKKTLTESLNEVEQIRKGKLPKHSYKDMIGRVRDDLKEDK